MDIWNSKRRGIKKLSKIKIQKLPLFMEGRYHLRESSPDPKQNKDGGTNFVLKVLQLKQKEMLKNIL